MKPIEKDYSPTQWVKRVAPEKVVQQHADNVEKASAEVLKNIECHLNVPYGPKPNQKLDIFGLEVLPKSAPIFVFIHGGYWQDCRYDQYRYLSKPFVESGAVVITLGHDLVPSVTMEEIIEEIKEGTSYAMKIAKDRGSSGLFIAGYCPGGHLCSLMLAVNWNSTETGNSKMLKGVILISGIYDIRPLTQTYVNDPLKLTVETAWKMSPLRLAQNDELYCEDIDCLISVAENDPPAFHHQAEVFKNALHSCRAKSVKILTVSEADHFDYVENLANKDALLTKKILDMMHLKN